jgi:hypothetical protein
VLEQGHNPRGSDPMKLATILGTVLAAAIFQAVITGCGQDVATCSTVCALPRAASDRGTACPALETACSADGYAGDF